MPIKLLENEPSKAIIRQHIEALANEYEQTRKEGAVSLGNTFTLIMTKLYLNDQAICRYSNFAQELADRFLPAEFDAFSKSINASFWSVFAILFLGAAILPMCLDHLINIRPRASEQQNHQRETFILISNPNANLDTLRRHADKLQNIIIKEQKLNTKHRQIIFLLYLLAILFIAACYAIAKSISIQTDVASILYIAPFIPRIYGTISFKIYIKQKEKEDALFANYLAKIISDIPGLAYKKHQPAGSYSTYFEINCGPYTNHSIGSFTFENVQLKYLKYHDIMKIPLLVLSQENSLHLAKYDPNGIVLQPKVGWQQSDALQNIRSVLLNNLINKNSNLEIRKRILPLLIKALSPLYLEWQAIEVSSYDRPAVLQFIATITNIEYQQQQFLITELKKIFTSSKVNTQHDEIIISPTLEDIHKGFALKILQNQIERLLQPVMSPPPASAAASVTTSSLENINPPSSIIKRKHISTQEEPKSTLVENTSLQISWPGFNSFDSSNPSCGVYSLSSLHTTSFRFFFFIHPKLNLDEDLVSKMKTGKIIGEQGQGFKRTGSAYRDYENRWQTAFFKFKNPARDGRAYARIVDTKTNPKHMLLVVDGYDPHPHKK